MVMTNTGIRFWIYDYNSSTKRWEFDTGNYLTWSPGPSAIAVKRKVEWKSRSTGTKQLKVFKFKGRQVGTITLTGRVGTRLYSKLEYLSISKIVLDVRAQYTEPGGSIFYYPLLSPITPYLGEGSIDDLTDLTTLSVSYETSSFYIVTGVTGKSKEYAMMIHPDENPSKVENVVDVVLILERVDTTKITPSSPDW